MNVICDIYVTFKASFDLQRCEVHEQRLVTSCIYSAFLMAGKLLFANPWASLGISGHLWAFLGCPGLPGAVNRIMILYRKL